MSEFERPIYSIVGGVGRWVRPSALYHRTPYFTYYALYRAGMAIQDLFKAGIQINLIDKLKGSKKGLANLPMPLCREAKTLSLAGLSSEVLETIDEQYNTLLDAWKAGIGAGMGSSYGAAGEQFTNTGQLLYAYSTLQYQTSVIPRMRRHWLRKYTPSVPNDYMAWMLWKRGHIGEADFNTFCSYDGWDSKGIGYLKKIWQQIPNIYAAWQAHLKSALTYEQFLEWTRKTGWNDYEASLAVQAWLTVPSTREAFHMERRGIIDTSTRNKTYQAQGYLSGWWDFITANYEHIPNPLNSFKMMMRGALTKAQFNAYIYQNGWSSAFASKFETLYKNVPTSHEAFFMWKKGLIGLADRNLAYKAYGWLEGDHAKITENYYYVPSLYDLTRIADYVEVDTIWATQCLRRRGHRDSDIAKILPMLSLRPLRDEIVRQTQIWRNRFKLGWASVVELDAALTDMLGEGYIQATEKILLTEEAELMYEDELMAEQITIYMWWFRMAAITEAQYLAGLLGLGIRREKANLMVEEQTAMGYYGYY